MPSLKSFRNRIASVKSTQKITKAMQLVAATKARRARENAQAAAPYAARIAAVVANLAQSVAGEDSAPALMRGTGRDTVHLLVVVTAERGLCGGFNGNIVKLARQEIGRLTAAGKVVKLLTVGRKGRDLLKRTYGALMIDHVDLSAVRRLGAAEARKVLDQVLPRFDAGEFDVATLIYSRFQSVLAQIPTASQLIPVKAETGGAPGGMSAGESDLNGAAYEYEPDETAILEGLLPLYVSSRTLNALLQNAAGEQPARMAAMDNATRNAGDLIKKLTLQYNRQRQANITRELIEIISGAEAL